jgi:large subunit ribosomal protein L10
MRREEKDQLIDELKEKLADNSTIYLADISELNSVDTSDLRRLCFKKDIKLMVVKNTLLKKAMDKSDREFDPLYAVLKGNTSLMFSETGNAPAKLIQEFRKKSDKPILKGAFIEDVVYIGDDQLEFLANIKSKDELIGDIILLLQSPVKNVMGALQSGGHKLSGILETLAEKEN